MKLKPPISLVSCGAVTDLCPQIADLGYLETFSWYLEPEGDLDIEASYGRSGNIRTRTSIRIWDRSISDMQFEEQLIFKEKNQCHQQ